MSDLRTAAHQALEAWDGGDVKWFANGYQVMDALRTALEQPEQEPVAWMVYTQDGKSVCVTDHPADFIEWRSFPLYTHPPRREWRGVTEKEIDAVWEDAQVFNTHYDIARAIEAALKERNA